MDQLLKKRTRRFLAISAIVLCSATVGAVFGPVAIAVAGATFAPATAFNGHVIEAGKLVEAYRARLEPGILFRTIAPSEDGAECGYDPEVVFPRGIEALSEARRKNVYVDYVGYYVLDQWRYQNRDEAWIGAIVEEIRNRVTPFEAGFLRRCIEGTIFADLCMRKVEQFGNIVPRFDRHKKTGLMAEGFEDRVVCAFVDGVAARRGIPLSSMESAKE